MGDCVNGFTEVQMNPWCCNNNQLGFSLVMRKSQFFVNAFLYRFYRSRVELLLVSSFLANQFIG